MDFDNYLKLYLDLDRDIELDTDLEFRSKLRVRNSFPVPFLTNIS